MRRLIARCTIGLAAAFLLAGSGLAGEKKLMHCFYFTPVKTATEADWQAFFKATDDLPNQIPGLSRVWYGKLRRNLVVFNPDGETRKKAAAGGTVTGQVTQVVREFGVCMELADEAALNAYAKHPAHTKWNEIYSKVREPGTTTMDILGQ
ncbi:MAG TPA: hypothetical protein PLA43_05000 [Bryobacteraceae bacterium]|nr:hypothetical protein [Bryobacteraceae bacterium]HOQ45220.1 hypothetical protein [Bryobacteraceae bacterium]HPQ17041.1 hypothetical protein [Bryobacteraceae bacterium]HPU71292.1 hypothetical protein [Bryobacteraceae bacterium]